MADYNIGDLVQLTAMFTTTATGAAVDPTTVVITIRDPGGTQSTPAVSHPVAGTFQTTVAAAQAGEWRWRATGTGAAQASDEATFLVAANSF